MDTKVYTLLLRDRKSSISSVKATGDLLPRPPHRIEGRVAVEI